MSLKLNNGSRIAVIGGGPSGSFFSYFLLDLADRVGLSIDIDIFESQDFSRFGPKGCNKCGGIISESLVQHLASEGITLPSTVVQRGIDSYMLHMDVGSVRIDTPLHEKRIAAIYRGAGPLGSEYTGWESFDGYMLELTQKRGASLIRDRVQKISFTDGLPLVETKGGVSKQYELVVGAVGVNSSGIKLFQDFDFGFKPPGTTKTFIGEFRMGRDVVHEYFGSSMHVFQPNIPRLEFGALIPKGEHVTLVLLGSDIDKNLVATLLNTPEVKGCFPPGWDMSEGFQCQCYPKINVRTAVKPYTDRIVLLGDNASTKLYKNGIGAAYIAAKAAATTVAFHGISSADFEEYYWPTCRKINSDNGIGKLIFMFTHLIQKLPVTRMGILRMVANEQIMSGKKRRMSTVLWDTFTGSATYREIFIRALDPRFILTLIWEIFLGLFFGNRKMKPSKKPAVSGTLGRIYSDGETIIEQGELGDCMYVIQEGRVIVIQTEDGKEIELAELIEGDFFGEMGLFERDVRSSTVRARGETRVLTVDKETLMHRIEQDPTMAFRIVERMSARIRELNRHYSRSRVSDRRNWLTRPERQTDTQDNRISVDGSKTVLSESSSD